jgi:hypothetical protein
MVEDPVFRDKGLGCRIKNLELGIMGSKFRV